MPYSGHEADSGQNIPCGQARSCLEGTNSRPSSGWDNQACEWANSQNGPRERNDEGNCKQTAMQAKAQKLEDNEDTLDELNQLDGHPTLESHTGWTANAKSLTEIETSIQDETGNAKNARNQSYEEGSEAATFDSSITRTPRKFEATGRLPNDGTPGPKMPEGSQNCQANK
ncbi:hypothetical protein R1flu_007032 [Riccia fluitans]|uniref:Uncharacterized protein n=1 Tax=Riccia fluitans TaxID=41844 RepID=A0ABD1YXP2_9MARC